MTTLSENSKSIVAGNTSEVVKNVRKYEEKIKIKIVNHSTIINFRKKKTKRVDQKSMIAK